MSAFIVTVLVVLALLALLGGLLTFAWLCGVTASRTMSWALGVRPDDAQRQAASAQEDARIEQLIRETRAAAGLPPIN